MTVGPIAQPDTAGEERRRKSSQIFLPPQGGVPPPGGEGGWLGREVLGRVWHAG